MTDTIRKAICATTIAAGLVGNVAMDGHVHPDAPPPVSAPAEKWPGHHEDKGRRAFPPEPGTLVGEVMLTENMNNLQVKNELRTLRGGK